MYWLAATSDQRERALIRRFNPLYWTVNFPRPMMAAVVSDSADALTVTAVFHRRDDLAGLIWESEDRHDHPLLAYETVRDYSGVVLSFRWQSENLRLLHELHGPTLTIEGRDDNGDARSWYVRLWNYAEGDPDDAVITLDFDDLAGGFLLPGEADPVYPGDIDRLFISLTPPDYDPELPDAMTTVEASVTLSAISVSGPNAPIAIGDIYVKPHGLALANGYDDSLHLSPRRLLRNVLQLGYRDWLDHYLGMSHFFSLAWNVGEARFVIDPGLPVLNAAALAWHEDFLSHARLLGFRVVLSLSFELFNAHAPQAWKQRTHDGSPALTGWEPPSTLISPTHVEALDYLKAVFVKLADLQAAADMEPCLQIGEPWWWYQWTAPHEPCFYDAATTALYESETGLTAPTPHLTIFEVPTPQQLAYLAWLGGKLGTATLALRDAAKAAHPTAQVTLLLFTPQVLNPAAPMMKAVNLPAAAWAYPAFDFLQVEDYDHVIAGDWTAHRAGLQAVADELGYGPADSHYFAGFNLLAEASHIWGHIDSAIASARRAGYAEIFVWAFSQVARDGFVHSPDQETDMSGFHEIRFPDRIAFGTTGGPKFSTSVVEAASGHEQRNMEWAEARAEYDVGSGLGGEQDVAALIAFFRARKGRAFGFRFKDWSDWRSSSGAVTALDQNIGVGDGAAVTFQLRKIYASGPVTHQRIIAKPVAGTVRVALDGVEAMAGWGVDSATGIVTFDSAPGTGVAVSAGFEFDVPARFREDQLNISLETFAAGEAPSVGLIEIRT